jgi:hypothetical protein
MKLSTHFHQLFVPIRRHFLGVLRQTRVGAELNIATSALNLQCPETVVPKLSGMTPTF